MLSVDEARARVLAGLDPVGSETVGLAEAVGRVLAAAVHARLDQPASDISAMDGYAVRAAEAVPGATLAVTGEAPAGAPLDRPLAPGSAIRLFTGSVIPEGADAVLMQENARRDGDTIGVGTVVGFGQHIRRRGGDFNRGDAVLAPGTRLGARAIALAAAANHPFLSVRRRPRIALLATGDELVLPGEPLRHGALPSSNSTALAAFVTAAGGVPLLPPIAPDDVDAIAAAAAAAATTCDMVVTLGGASVGDRDLIRPALARFGFDPDVPRIAMRPGKPLMHGAITAAGRSVPVLGLPGNPVSALVCAALFLRPAIAALLGLDAAAPPTRTVRLGGAVGANDARADHLRARLVPGADGIPVATPIAVQDSARLADLARAGALVLRAPFAPALEAGALADALLLDELGL